MQNCKTLIMAICWCCVSTLSAEQGMWIPPVLPDTLFSYLDEAGSDLLPEDIYSEQDTCLKDQVVYLSNGYSGVLLSDQGLLLTNYTPFIPFINHTDSLKQGFTALSPLQEIPIKNLYALQLKRTQNITHQVLSQLPDSHQETALQQAIDSICQQIYLSQSIQPGHMVQIECTSTQQYYLYEYARYDDVRLVYLPHNNMAVMPCQSAWMPQRHEANFCLLRLYTSRDNTPSAYTEFNRPAQNMPYATISQMSKHVGDPVFYLGYPNFSERFLLADELEERFADDNAKIKVWQFLKQHHQADTQAMQDSVLQEQAILKRLQLVEKKRQQEWQFTYWAANHPHFETALRYGNLLPLLHQNYAIRNHHLQQYRINNTLFSHVNSIKMGQLFLDMNTQNERATLQQMSQLFGQLDLQTEPVWLASALDYYQTACDSNYLPEFYALIQKKYKGNTLKYVNQVLKKSFITNEKRFTKYLDQPNEKQRTTDPLLQLCTQLKQVQRLHYLLYAQTEVQIARAKRLYQTGLIQKDSSQIILADANYSLRMGYGAIQGYTMGSGIQVDAFALLQQRGQQSYLQTPTLALDSSWQQAIQNDTIFTDFFTTCDAPYGRMGHAVYNAHGELLGIMSNVNPEGKYNTYIYDSTYQRTQVSDIHYLIFLLEQSNAQDLVEELTFGEKEQIVQIQYVTPSPMPFIFTRDSIQINDSTWVVLSDSLLNDSAFVATHDSLLRHFSLLKDSTALQGGDSISLATDTLVSGPSTSSGTETTKESMLP